MRAVFNSSPWIFLAKLDILPAALSLFDSVIIPLSVESEILGKADIAGDRLVACLREGTIEVVQARNAHFVSAMNRRLGYGEAEAIAIALEELADMVVLDDHAARAEGMRVGLQVKGTLSLIRRLMEMEKIRVKLTELRSRLQEMDFRVKEKIFWEIFNGFRE